MRKLNLILFSILVVLLVSACASKKTMYFTQELRKNVESYDIKLEEIQFYNSNKIELERNLTYEETKVASGKIRFENGQYIERIIIKSKTQGVCELFDENSINVSFEQGDNRQLIFVRNNKDMYQISAFNWENKYGRISYDTTEYFIAPGGQKALLKVKKEDIFNFKKQERVAPGRSVTTK